MLRSVLHFQWENLFDAEVLHFYVGILSDVGRANLLSSGL